MSEYGDDAQVILGRLETCARWISEARDMVDHALAERRQLITDARAAGVTMVDIAYAAHISRETAHRLIQLSS